MKVAYISCLLGRDGFLGVEKKLVSQARAAGLLGLDMDVFFINYTSQLDHRRISFGRRKDSTLSPFLHVLNRYACVSRHVNADDYDRLLLRYSGADFSLFSPFFRHHAHRTVTEHHTKELYEAYTYKSSYPQRTLTIMMERFLGPQMIRRCRGLIGLTEEIKDYEVDRIGCSIPACSIANGILVRDIPVKRAAKYKGDVLTLLCIAGSFDKWHGLDRVFEGLADYAQRKPRLHLRVVGDVTAGQAARSGRAAGKSNVSIEFLGRLNGPKLEAVYEASHIAFSSLASFRANVTDACALKTREFVARGIPFVIGHRDPDLSSAENFFLPVPPDDSPVDMERVVAFADEILNVDGIHESMRRFAEQRLDWTIKMQQTWDFLKSTL